MGIDAGLKKIKKIVCSSSKGSFGVTVVYLTCLLTIVLWDLGIYISVS
jgi:hypothetical protein